VITDGCGGAGESCRLCTGAPPPPKENRQYTQAALFFSPVPHAPGQHPCRIWLLALHDLAVTRGDLAGTTSADIAAGRGVGGDQRAHGLLRAWREALLPEHGGLRSLHPGGVLPRPLALPHSG